MVRFLLGLLVGAGGLYALSVYRATPSTPPAAAVAAPSAPAGIEQQVSGVDRALADAARTGKAVAITVVFTEPQLQAAAAAYFPQSFAGATLTDPVVRLRPGRIVLDMTATVAFLRTGANVVGTPLVRAGRPAVRIDAATIGGQPIPDGARDAIAGQLAQALSAGLPERLVVATIEVTDGRLTLTGSANP